MFDEWIMDILFSNDDENRLYINENVNGDICLFLGIVYVFCVNGKYKFIYKGYKVFLFLFF